MPPLQFHGRHRSRSSPAVGVRFSAEEHECLLRAAKLLKLPGGKVELIRLALHRFFGTPTGRTVLREVSRLNWTAPPLSESE